MASTKSTNSVLLLDTHVWIWSVEGAAKRIGRKARRSIETSATRRQIRVSPVTIFEVTALCAGGRLHLAQPTEQWIRNALDRSGIHVAELSINIAIDAGHISRSALADPMDRLLVATARLLNATFMTADTSILTYAAETGQVRVADASE